MFKSLTLLVCLTFVIIELSMAVPIAEDREKEIVPIIKSEIIKEEDGSYNLEYETGDGTIRMEKASVITTDNEDTALEIKGSYKYINDEGHEVEVFYTAGVNGFVPYGSIINPEITAVAESAKNLPKEDPLEYKTKKNKQEYEKAHE